MGPYSMSPTQGEPIGTGQLNTPAIVGKEVCNSGAACLCEHMTSGGYDDWFLPSRGELNAMYTRIAAIGGFSPGNDAFFWSSAEFV